MAIIQEKGLVRAIKAAYSHGGYTVLNQGAQVTIYTEGWFVRCPWPKLPRKALATIVEHMGMIPDDGEAVTIERMTSPRPSWPGSQVTTWPDGWAERWPAWLPMSLSFSGGISYSRR